MCFRILFVIAIVIVGASFSARADAGERPNIVLIVADDLGFSDVGFNGCQEIPTPRLDALAESGVVFSSGYASHPYCSPSRAGLLTGRYQQRFGHEANPPHDPEWHGEETAGMPLSEQTLADALKEAGYVTGAIGKWHLGDAKPMWPNRRGFDEWFGFSGGGLSYWGAVGNKPQQFGVHRNDEPVDVDTLTHLTDDFSTEAVKFVQRHQDDPFFLYLAYNAPHAPDQATRAHLKHTEHIEYGGRAVYGAMVAGMDAGIGRVVDEIERQGLSEKTLVIFYSDNGGRREHARNFPFRGHKGMLFEGGIRVPFLMNWPNKLPSGVREDAPVMALDLFPTVLAAAGVSPSEASKLDGENLLPSLTQDDVSMPKRPLFWRYSMGDGNYGYAVRDGRWKLVDTRYKDRKMLFDLQSDPYETRDLSDDHPERVAELWQKVVAWDADNLAPRWNDPHGVNVRKEEAERTRQVENAARGERTTDGINLSAMMQPVPAQAKFIDEDQYIWGGSMVRDADGVCHLFYSRWPRELGHMAWVTHSEIAHATSDHPLGPYKFVDVALPARGKELWDGLCTHNPTVHKFDGKYYIYYMGNTGDGNPTKKLNYIHRNNQRIGVAVADHPNGPWKRMDQPLIDITPDDSAPDALMVSNPSMLRRDDGTFVLIYKAVGKNRRVPFGGPVVHLAALSQSPTGPFVKEMEPLFTSPGVQFAAEDPYIWFQDGKCWAIVNDHQGMFNGVDSDSLALFESVDGLQWQVAKSSLVTKRVIAWADGIKQPVHRLERPQLFLQDGEPAVLFCAAEETEAKLHSFNVHIPLKPVESIK
ncbi:sulfatase-like hydrolase/transferase [Rhodopirellula sp. JC740]|uniref:Sulfatase-like hydrolase/transferase n=1 Tax=Rhodopirellula halodulae TaxID=2894198 RepID=A0ABS8NIF3_9BACT|nr:sulfatase-like hydrolase/transferase [Rhodopirellula sp. JC740]MCC9643311.1 sulfatase-like hydrolase/transferase [Rhodopirellula sp. JC740]